MFVGIIKIYFNNCVIKGNFVYICHNNLNIIKIRSMTKIELGQKIKERRQIMSLVQSQLAEYTGLSVVTLSQIERGKANPSFDTLNEIFHFLHLEIKLVVKNR